jgi:hypothetical protein
MRAVSDPFADVGLGTGRGTGKPASSSARRDASSLRKLSALERARHLAAAFNEHDAEKYPRRLRFYEEEFDLLLEALRLTVTSPVLPYDIPDDEPGMCCELVANERLPDGPPVGWLLVRWDKQPFATLLLADTPPS